MPLKSIRILKLGCHFSILRYEAQIAVVVVNPALIEGEKQVTSRSQGPPHTALPPYVMGAVIVL